MEPRILVIDDDQDLVDLVRPILEQEGFAVAVESHSTPEAVRSAVRRLEPDCILLDGGSPAGYGQSWEDAAWVAGRPRPVPVIMFTASTGAADEARDRESLRSRAANLFAVIDKPFDVGDLVGTVRRAIEAPSMPPGGAPVGVPQGSLLETLEQLMTLPAATLKEALDQASLLLADVFRAEKVDAWLANLATDELVAVGVSDTPLGRKQVALGLNRFNLSEQSRVGDVFKTGQPYLTGRADLDDGVPPGVCNALGVRSMMAVPLEVGGERRGVLLVSSPQPERYTENDLRFLGTVARWVGMVAQRSELAEQQVALEAAQQAVRARDEFLSIASHELRNPLASLTGMAQMLNRLLAREQPDLERVRRNAAGVQTSADRLVRLVDDLLDVSRLRTGQFHIRPVASDLTALIRDAVERVTLLSPERRIVLDEACHGEPCTISADPDRLGQVIANLLENAVKYSPESSEVHVRLIRERGGVMLQVEDQGIGLPPGTEERIFQPFGRAPNAEARNIPGMGLGLYVSRQIVEAHGGRLWAESAGEGQGATFSLWLPLTPDAAATPA